MSLSAQEHNRYSRHFSLDGFGVEEQLKLKKAKVLLIGCGGLGCPCALYLTAIGVGTIGIIDDDLIDESNLHRQILYKQSDVGQAKVTVAQKRLTEQNPYINITAIKDKLTSDNALQIIAGYDLVIDGTDNFPTRYLVNDACVILDKINVYASVSQFEGQLAVFNYLNLDGTRGPNYRDVYPTPPNPDMVTDCATGGVLGVLPGLMGTMQATEAIKVITGISEPLSNHILLFDALSMSSRKLKVRKNPNLKISQLINYDDFCGIKSVNNNTMNEITVQELKQWMDEGKDFQLLDVREQHEFDFCNLNGELIPLATILDDTAKISTDKPVVVHCRSGARSANAIMALKDRLGNDNMYNLKGGILAWSKEIDPSVPQY